MKDLTGQEDSVTSLPAADWNELAQEQKNLIEDLVAASSSGDLDQLGKAIANYAAANFFTGGGAADVQTATKIGDKQALSQLDAITDGILVRYRPSAANTGAATLNVNALGAKSVVREDGSTLSASDLDTVRDAIVRWDQSLDKWRLLNSALSDVGNPVPARGYIDGFIMRPDPVDTIHDVEIEEGICRDSSDTKIMERTSPLTKKIDVDWIAGDNAGGFPSALTLAVDTWYHVFLIKKDSDGSIDAGFDTSVSAANLLTDATGYTEFRRIGSVLTDGSMEIIPFSQFGDQFLWDVGVQEFSTGNPGTAEVLPVLTVPLGTGINVLALFHVELRLTQIANRYLLVTSPSQANTAPTSSLWSLLLEVDTNENEFVSSEFMTRTNDSGQVRYRLDASAANTTVDGHTRGWVDPRGKDA